MTSQPHSPSGARQTLVALKNTERDNYYFDFRVVMLMMVLISHPELLQEYLNDGKAKDPLGVPLAVKDPSKWKTLRTLFSPTMLGQVMYLWERPQAQQAAQQMFLVLQTMINWSEYDFNGCPNPIFIKAMVDYARQQTAQLHPAGVSDD